ncbi:MAG: dihydroorotate dehydrogenase [Candidatus Brocadiia bacterium]|jgi:dihydroorotate dehydrogenase (NAD+) catalytic subunit|nr:dihydroorotate dehydrogenase [Candidatus Brocadiia bacterium]
MADISANLGGIELANPTVLASGVLGLSKDLLVRVAEAGAGAATIKSVSPEPREGHANPTVIAYEAGMLNAVGYSNAGLGEAQREFAEVAEIPIPIFASAIGRDADEFAAVAEGLMRCGFAALEIPLSCPHTPGYGTLAGHSTREATEAITRAVRQVTDRPIFVKLSPNVPAIGELALAALEGGADGISAVNTLGPGMVINLEARRPVLAFGAGGVSGPALRPVAVRCVYDVAAALRRAGRSAPIIGIGGVSTGRHALQMIMAGAAAVGIGTGVYERGLGVFRSVAEELAAECDRLGIESLSDVIGAVHG